MELARYRSVSVIAGQFFNGARRGAARSDCDARARYFWQLPVRPESAH